MSQFLRTRIEILHVSNDAGQLADFIAVIPVVTQTTLDGANTEAERQITITTRWGEHVSRRSETEFETTSGERWRLVTR